MAEERGEPAYRLFLEPEEAAVARTALGSLDADEGHAPRMRSLAAEVLALLGPPAGGHETLTVPLSPPQMKITHTAVKLLHDDLGREEAEEREVLRRILDKLPDEHTIRAIRLD